MLDVMGDPAMPAEVGIGTILSGSYQIQRQIGRGGMGVVWEARHLRLPKRVAVKVLQSTVDRDHVARFRQEAEIASRLCHANIVEVLDFDTLPSGTPYFVMEMLDGESLASRLQRAPLDTTEALSILRQIGAALHAAHSAGVSHRDLKPENVFLVPREHDGAIAAHVKILDFGISKVQGSDVVRTREELVLGTPQYMAPEQATAKHGAIDARTDQFALGVIAFEMLAGRAPFGGTNTTEVMFKIVYEHPPPLGTLARDADPHVVDAIERAMAKSPSERHADVSAFVAALTGRPLADRPSSRVESVARPETATVPSARGRAPRSGEEITIAGTQALGSRPSADEQATVAASPRHREPAELPRDARRSALSYWVIASAFLAAAGVTGVAVLSRNDDTEVRSEAPRSDVGQDRPATSSLAPISTEPGGTTSLLVAGSASVMPGVAPDAATDGSSAGPPPRDRAVRQTKDTVPSEIDEQLAIGEASLLAGRISEAEVIAKRVLYRGKYARAYQLLAASSCARRDLGAVHAWMRNLSRSAWPSVRARCKSLGFEIEDPPA